MATTLIDPAQRRDRPAYHTVSGFDLANCLACNGHPKAILTGRFLESFLTLYLSHSAVQRMCNTVPY